MREFPEADAAFCALKQESSIGAESQIGFAHTPATFGYWNRGRERAEGVVIVGVEQIDKLSRSFDSETMAVRR